MPDAAGPTAPVGNPKPTVIGLLSSLPVAPDFRSHPTSQNFPSPLNNLRPSPPSGQSSPATVVVKRAVPSGLPSTFSNEGLEPCQERPFYAHSEADRRLP